MCGSCSCYVFFQENVNCSHRLIIIKELLHLWLFDCFEEESSFVAVGEVTFLRFVCLLLVEQDCACMMCAILAVQENTAICWPVDTVAVVSASATIPSSVCNSD